MTPGGNQGDGAQTQKATNGGLLLEISREQKKQEGEYIWKILGGGKKGLEGRLRGGCG